MPPILVEPPSVRCHSTKPVGLPLYHRSLWCLLLCDLSGSQTLLCQSSQSERARDSVQLGSGNEWLGAMRERERERTHRKLVPQLNKVYNEDTGLIRSPRNKKKVLFLTFAGNPRLGRKLPSLGRGLNSQDDPSSFHLSPEMSIFPQFMSRAQRRLRAVEPRLQLYWTLERGSFWQESLLRKAQMRQIFECFGQRRRRIDECHNVLLWEMQPGTTCDEATSCRPSTRVQMRQLTIACTGAQLLLFFLNESGCRSCLLFRSLCGMAWWFSRVEGWSPVI